MIFPRFLRILVLSSLPLITHASFLPGSLDQHPRAAAVLAEKFIHVTGSGQVDITFEQASALLQRPDLLTDIQTAYAALLQEGQKPEFVIQAVEPGEYFFENRHRQTTRIFELKRQENEAGGIDFVLFAQGTRSFGDFQSLTHIQIQSCPENPEITLWEVQVFAYPENSMSRFFARNFGIAQRFFRSKTREISGLAVEISEFFAASEFSEAGLR